MTDSNVPEQQFVCIVPYNRKSKKLFVIRRCAKHSIGMWEFPSGKVELKERFADAASREFREETGVASDLHHLFDTHKVDITDDTKRWNTVYYLTETSTFDKPPTNNEPDIHSECGWFTLEELTGLDLVFPTKWMVDAISAGTVKL